MSIFLRFKSGVSRAAASVAVAALALPFKVLAASGQVGSGLSDIRGEFSGATGAFGSADNATELIAVIIRVLLLIGGAIAVLFVIIGGYQYLTSGGNEESAEKGRKTVTNALIGVVLIVLAWVIVNVVVGTISQ